MTETRAADPSTTPVWQPVTRVRSHDLVVEAVENQILGGVLRVGDPLPPERELASRLQVSRAGVREAIRVLESQGVVRSNVGAGREAGTFIAAMPSAAMQPPISASSLRNSTPCGTTTAMRPEPGFMVSTMCRMKA